MMLMSIIDNTFGRQADIVIPDIPGYQTLKGDFHMHTVFSDGHVWPTFRVKEALRDGMDVIAITEHMDYEGFPDEIEKDYNKSYEIAAAAAKDKGLMVIKGVEISPRVPPYHHNAIFLEDANSFPIDYMENTHQQFIMKDSVTRDQVMAPFLEAQRQGAFVSYNHPSYKWWDKKDTVLFTDFHQELLDKGILGGVEVVNSGRYNIIAHRMAMKYDLTMLCNTDEHYDMYPRYADTHRPMTLVFVEERSPEGVEEAMRAKRTALYFDDYIVARQKEAEALFKAAVKATINSIDRNGEPILSVTLQNTSDIPFHLQLKSRYDIELLPLGQLTLGPQEQKEVVLKAVWKTPDETQLAVTVGNVLVTPDEALETVFTFKDLNQ
ncbi:PHP family phosphohydrolase, histidinol phosphatase [Echinicola vietnamensis DSM 17526]|uniref:PHP family phosphohydrolase, histidinol phosphatase n=2 Tax=Echinicola TaxID=390846 RepID=L0G1E1_ECHVK|nr:PHP family phosphohydrolase, histidinol phosphatase [Echinicola vietnamensis DSM 17526]